ncbi:tetratricopeptide repeat protein [Anthocerotibacter panamensis]|uniref:tetratricopeptide repeat protein n=1 Tax=Anthocerotibacter panamensis TaxID=2857077 RepID=UPI001C40759D|nr:tetratricopeptide repeat protein [Anthocerotibacter panamensis]
MKKLILMLALSTLTFPALAQTTDTFVGVKYHENLAANYLAQGDPSSALEKFNEAIELDPLAARAYAGRANANRLLNYRKEALEDYKTALKLYATHRNASFELKSVQFELDLFLNESSPE